MGAGETLNLWALTLLFLPGTLGVRDLRVSMSSNPGSKAVREGDSVNLTCYTESCSWSDSGNYSCALKDQELTVSVGLSLEVERDVESGSAKLKMTTVVVAVGVFLFILAAALGIFMCVKRRRRDTQTVEKDMPRETQRPCRDPHSDTYASLDVKSISPEYDTLTGVKRAAKHTELHTSAEPEGTYSSLDVKSCSPNYDTLVFCEEGRRAEVLDAGLIKQHKSCRLDSGNYSCALKDQEPTVSMGFTLDVGESEEHEPEEFQPNVLSLCKIPSVTAAVAVVLFLLDATLGIIIYIKRRRRDTQTVEKDTPRETQSVTETKRDSKRRRYLWRCTATVVEMREKRGHQWSEKRGHQWSEKRGRQWSETRVRQWSEKRGRQ
ncbi:hypothetical protein AGIG_G23420 [Arapaima gigas]